MGPMIPIEVAVKGSKRLEGLLEKRFGATGRGLHEKLTSVEARIPEEVRRSIRWVATIRNKVVHEEGPAPAEKSEFVRRIEEVAKALEGRSTRAAANKVEAPRRAKPEGPPQRKRGKARVPRAPRVAAKPRRAPAGSRRRARASAAPQPRTAARAVTVFILLLAAGLVALWMWKM